MDRLITLIASVGAVLFVFVPHEFAHAFAAYKCGDGTAKMYGRLTLNPIKHLDPIGILLCIFTGFGWAKPVPINPYNFKNYRKGLFITAIAGVATNYVIAFIAYPLSLLLLKFVLSAIELYTLLYYVAEICYLLFYLIYLYSLTVFVFNLLPLFPLDGFRVVESLTREINPVRRFLKNYGQYILIILVFESFLCGILEDYTDLTYIKYFDVLGFYIQWFAKNIIGFPIKALWNVVFGLPIGL